MTRPTTTKSNANTCPQSRNVGNASTGKAAREKPTAQTDSAQDDGAGAVSRSPYEAIVAEYRERARAARMKQGLPEVVEDRSVLAKVSAWMSDDLERAKRQNGGSRVA